MSNRVPSLPNHVDVLVIGPGLSGIGAAYRLQTECPDRTYAIVAARETLGGRRLAGDGWQ